MPSLPYKPLVVLRVSSKVIELDSPVAVTGVDGGDYAGSVEGHRLTRHSFE
jgi:hypothetical protein